MGDPLFVSRGARVFIFVEDCLSVEKNSPPDKGKCQEELALLF